MHCAHVAQGQLERFLQFVQDSVILEYGAHNHHEGVDAMRIKTWLDT